MQPFAQKNLCEAKTSFSVTNAKTDAQPSETHLFQETSDLLCRKSLGFLKLPEILSFHLKRFKYDAYYPSKLDRLEVVSSLCLPAVGRQVDFPLAGLDMKPYLTEDSEEENTVYDLTAVVCHIGVAGGGHYIAYAVHPVTERYDAPPDSDLIVY